ncbi:hypothetical protein JCM16303_001324 [Sporobolomyces ruberrimus]
MKLRLDHDRRASTLAPSEDLTNPRATTKRFVNHTITLCHLRIRTQQRDLTNRVLELQGAPGSDLNLVIVKGRRQSKVQRNLGGGPAAKL